MKKLVIIAAVGKNRELGYKNSLIWHFKEDLKSFKDRTMNHYILMGKNTFNSLPHNLKGRKYLVLSKSLEDGEGYRLFRDKKSFLEFYDNIDEDVYVIGGSSIYKEFILDAQELILTEIDDSFPEASVYFPKFKKENYEKENLGEYKEDDIDYRIIRYIKK